MTREEKAAAMAEPMMHLLDEFCEANGRVPSTGEIVMWKEAQASGLDPETRAAHLGGAQTGCVHCGARPGADHLLDCVRRRGTGAPRGHRHDWRRDEFPSGVGAGTIMRRVCDTTSCGLVEVDHGRGWRRP
jgi:hypothetical protein